MSCTFRVGVHQEEERTNRPAADNGDLSLLGGRHCVLGRDWDGAATVVEQRVCRDAGAIGGWLNSPGAANTNGTSNTYAAVRMRYPVSYEPYVCGCVVQYAVSYAVGCMLCMYCLTSAAGWR